MSDADELGTKTSYYAKGVPRKEKEEEEEEAGAPEQPVDLAASGKAFVPNESSPIQSS